MNKSEPLTESYFYILLCLYEGSNHGYGIMQKTKELSNGRVIIGSGTMYGATSNMIKKGWIQETKSSDPKDERKRLYCLTIEGKKIFLQEYKRIILVIESAKKIIEEVEVNE